ncbi:PIN-like domain-containing protein [Pseudomonas kielensis]|uniref:PIN-like domain-containing protein n=1 Tax=Pseudomonas kielensis TaxID=2762577 RepID=UPI0038B14CBA
MKNSFPGQFANKPEKVKALWDHGIIALDANVLLDLYRYSDSTRAALINVLELLKDRIWISNQVAKEYFKNRLKVISDQAKLYDAAISELGKLKSGFENQKQHPFISSEALEGFVNSFDRLVSELKVNKEVHDARIYEDDIKVRLGDLFEGKVGSGYEANRLEAIIVDGAARYQHKVPPGFKDASKGGDGTLLIDRCAPYGDYIGWLQLMDKSKESGAGVIYVTGDNKEDWWLKHSGKTVGPLPELVDEFVQITEQHFYMYQPDRFLEYANSFLHQEASPEAVEEIREVRLDDVVHSPNFITKNYLNYRDKVAHGSDAVFGDNVAHYFLDSGMKSGLSVEGCKAYIANLDFRLDIARSGLERRVREFEMMDLGLETGRSVTKEELYEEMIEFENNVAKLNDLITVAKNYLVSITAAGL